MTICSCCRRGSFETRSKTSRTLPTGLPLPLAAFFLSGFSTINKSSTATPSAWAGVRLTADGDLSLDFNTPLSSGLVDTVKDGFSLKEITAKSLFSYSVTTTHLFGESTQDSRRAFFGGGSWSAGGAFPVHQAVGLYGGGVYSPSSGQAGFQTGFARPG